MPTCNVAFPLVTKQWWSWTQTTTSSPQYTQQLLLYSSVQKVACSILVPLVGEEPLVSLCLVAISMTQEDENAPFEILRVLLTLSRSLAFLFYQHQYGIKINMNHILISDGAYHNSGSRTRWAKENFNDLIRLNERDCTNKETSRSDTLVLRRYFQVTEYRIYEHTWDGF